MGFEYLALFSLFSVSMKGEQVTGFNETSVTGFPETSVTGIPDTTVTGFPETSVTGVPETSVTGFPETSNTGFFKPTVIRFPETSVTGFPETSVTGFPETSVTGFPETSVTGFPETSVTGFPKTSVTGFPETSVTGFPETTVTWIDAALHCYDQHTILENNVTILTDYISESNSVESLWIGSFVAWLPWIEIRGCYNISADMDTVTDIFNVDDPAVCQVKCMKTWKRNIQYFGFNQHQHRCVCFEDTRLVSEVSGNASLCSNVSAVRTYDRFVDVYKVFNRSVSNSTDEDNFCLARNCSSIETPTYSQSKCGSYFKAYCRNKEEAYSGTMTFITLFANCNIRHFAYPLLHSDTICNKKQPGDSTVMYWVGVYRQKLNITDLDKLDYTDFANIKTHISKFSCLSYKNNNTDFCNQSTTHNFMCKSVDELSTINHVSTMPTFVTSDTHTVMTDTEESSFGIEYRLIIGVTVSITAVMLIIAVILVLISRKIHRRNQPISRTLSKGESTSKLNQYESENILEGHYNDIDISNGDYCSANPVSDNIVNNDGIGDEESTYVRATSGVYDKLNEVSNRKIPTKNPNQKASEIEGVKMEVFTLTSNIAIDKKCEIDTLNSAMSSDYCIAKPITDTHKLDNSLDNADYVQLDNVEKDESAKAYDQWQITQEEDTDPTYDHSKNIIPRATHSNYDHCSIQK
ncbi:uncharacterized protein LOC127732049 isoform X2 [Mytilus californianus]|uniref:uncharacterized protein LOC127732049 isoform X2 n=1 Tax=Mytilus californianus TaxID=6549 RepID=UPI0022476E07|nr:uncharacterized protein LOC127732049 isoform X2 [Mytilus californianus]